jgi:hypothetical protein
LTLSLGELVEVELVVVPVVLVSLFAAQAVVRAATATTAETQARVRRERRGVMRPIVGIPCVPRCAVSVLRAPSVRLSPGR